MYRYAFVFFFVNVIPSKLLFIIVDHDIGDSFKYAICLRLFMVDNNRWRAKRENVTNLAYGVITGLISKRKSDWSAFFGSGSAMM